MRKKKNPRGRVVDPGERKARNRSVLFVAVLALLNAWVFLSDDGGLMSRMGELPGAVVGGGKGPLDAHADAPEQACGGHPVRIFDGLEDLVQLETALNGGRTLRLALLELGLDGPRIDPIEAAVRRHMDLGLVAGSGAPLRIATDRFGTVHALEIELSEGQLVQACRREGILEVRNIQHPMRSDVSIVALELGRHADLRAAVLAADEAPELARFVAETLAQDVDFAVEARPEDTVQIMLEKRWLGRHFHRYGTILGVRYIGAAGRIAYFRYKPEAGSPGMFDMRGKSMRRRYLRSPIGYHRVNPDARALEEPRIEHVKSRIGLVYRVPEGTPVVALSDGVIRLAQEKGADGLTLEITADDGSVVRYANLMRFIGPLEPGRRVRQGQTVALAGHSGMTAHDRVRLELHDAEGNLIDPMLLTAKGARRPRRVGKPIPEALMKRFVADVKPWAKALRRAG